MLMKPMTVQRNAKNTKNLFVLVDDDDDPEGVDDDEDASFRRRLDVGVGEVCDPEDGGDAGLEFSMVM